MFDRENAEHIEKFNAHTGMKHRSTPYDLTNPADLKQAFRLTVAACMDYRDYRRTMEQVYENFDESIEYYDTASWINMGYDPEKADTLSMEALGALSETSDLFGQLAERADRSCTVILKAILASPPDVQREVWGRAYSFPPEEVDHRIAGLFEEIDEAETHYEMEKNLTEFLSVMAAVWSEA